MFLESKDFIYLGKWLFYIVFSLFVWYPPLTIIRMLTDRNRKTLFQAIIPLIYIPVQFLKIDIFDATIILQF